MSERGGMYSAPTKQLYAGRMVCECGAIGQWRFDDGRGQGQNCGQMSFSERKARRLSQLSANEQ